MSKHRFLNSLISSGLSFFSILLSYAPGSNIGNFHFLWKEPSEIEPTTCFEHSQPSIEQAKQQIPVFHTCAMRASCLRHLREFPQMWNQLFYDISTKITGKIHVRIPNVLQNLLQQLWLKYIIHTLILVHVLIWNNSYVDSLYIVLGNHSASTNTEQSVFSVRRKSSANHRHGRF